MQRKPGADSSAERGQGAIVRMWRFLRSIKNLRRIVPTKDALRLTVANGKGKELNSYLRPVGRNVVLRSGTSDLSCLKQVFLAQEYRTPYAVEPKLIIDAGANIGMATLFFANEYPKARIVAIEPEASNFGMLKRNCAGLTNVDLVHAALWPSEEKVVIQDATAEKWAFSVAAATNSNGSEMVKAVTIPGLLNQLGAEHIDILKLDIEGAERELFAREAGAWLEKVGLIMIELHDYLVAGCAYAFYSTIVRYPFVQEVQGRNTVINFNVGAEHAPLPPSRIQNCRAEERLRTVLS